MTTRTDCDPNRVCIFRDVLNTRRSLVLGFVELEAYLGEVIEFWDSASLDLGGDTAFENTVEECVDVGFFGEVDKRFGVVGSLHFFQVLDDFLRTLARPSQQNFKYTFSKGRDVNSPISSFSESVIPYS